MTNWAENSLRLKNMERESQIMALMNDRIELLDVLRSAVAALRVLDSDVAGPFESILLRLSKGNHHA